MDSNSGKKFKIKNGAARSVIGLIAGIALFFTGVAILNFVYVSPNLENRIMWKSFYSQNEIDTVFIGSSLVFCGVDINTYENMTGEKAFDLSTGSQRLHEAYYNLREADKRYDIKKVYLELDSMLETYMFGDYTNPFVITSSWTDTDYIRLGLNKIRGVYDINGYEYLIQAFFPFTRYRAYIFDKNHILDTVTIKRSKDYGDYTYRGNYPDGNGYHETSIVTKGYWNTTRVLENPVCIQAQKREQMHITEDAERYLRKIIDYCIKEDISLSLFMCPMYATTLISTEDYDVYFDSVKEIASEYGIPLYDFNLVKENYLELAQDEYFDVSHLNSKGAEKFTRLFVQVAGDSDNASGSSVAAYDLYDSDNEAAYFYTSYNDKLTRQEPRLYGLYFINMVDRIKLNIAASNGENILFRVTFTPNDENGNPMEDVELPLQEFDANRTIQLPVNTHGTFNIYAKMQNDDKEFQTMSCIY